MLELLQKNTFSSLNLKENFSKLIQIYGAYNIDENRKNYLTTTIDKYGYIPYPHYKALEELTEGETVFSLIKIFEKEGVYKNSKFVNFNNPSVLSRNKIKNSDWFKKESHNIKLVSLSALGGDDDSGDSINFIDWLKLIVCLPKGNRALNVFADTIYLLPFHPREFGCAYLPKSSDVSEKLKDKKIEKFLGLNQKDQVKLFIALSQLAGHPVIYDILPQTARYSKQVLSKPYIARWMNINELTGQYIKAIDEIEKEIIRENQYDINKISYIKNKYTDSIMGSNDELFGEEKEIFELFDKKMKDIKLSLSNAQSLKSKQEKLVSEVTSIIESVQNKKVTSENDIINQNETTNALMQKGYWPMPGGAWCSAFIPVFDKMHPNEKYPLYKHYNYKGEDVTKFANLDCQTPYYFVYLENGKFNDKVVDFYLNYTLNLQKEYNFDGFRVDHVDHITDNLSEQNEKPISYRIPRKVLGKVSANLKKNVPYFGMLAEYMLWDNYYKEYHQDMGFDLLWGNDIVSQSSKTPKQIIKDNEFLASYNKKSGGKNHLSILKTYNNQDGEFEAIDRFPAQLGRDGALFKWFKYKFLPFGEFANRPFLYIDGDESFTDKGIEKIIGSEVSLKRNKDWDFYEKFNAINYFAQNSKIITTGTSKLLIQDENGLAAWEINSPFGSILVVANYKNPTEKITYNDEWQNCKTDIVRGETIYNSKVSFEGRKLKTFFEFSYDENQKCILKETMLQNLIENEITLNVLKPAEFKIWGYEK